MLKDSSSSWLSIDIRSIVDECLYNPGLLRPTFHFVDHDVFPKKKISSTKVLLLHLVIYI